MRLLPDANDSQSRARVRRTLAVTVILLVALSFLLTLLHPQPGPDADLLAFVRGLLVGIALALSVGTLMVCARRPRNSS